MHVKKCYLDEEGILVSSFDDVDVRCWHAHEDECIASCAAFYLDDKVHCLALPRTDNIIAELVEAPTEEVAKEE